ARTVVPGIAGGSKADPADLLHRYPGARYVRVFVGPHVLNKPDDLDYLVRRIRNVCEPVWAAGAVPIVSVKLNVAQVAAGRWERTLHEYGGWAAAQAQAGRRMVMVFWHEPEDD